MNTTTKNIIAFLFISLFTIQTSFATIYNTVKNGNFNMSNTWSPSRPIMNSSFNDTIYINHQITFNSKISVYGHFVVNNNGYINANSRTLFINDGASFINNGRVKVNKMTGSWNHNGITNNGTIDIKAAFKNEEGIVINNSIMNIGGTYTNSWDGITYNNGTLNADIYLINNHKFYGNGSLNINGNLKNYLEFIYTGDIVINGNFINEGTTTTDGNVEIGGNINNDWSSKITFNDTAIIIGNIKSKGQIIANSILNLNNLTSEAKVTLNGNTNISGSVINKFIIENNGNLNITANYKNIDYTTSINNTGVINIGGSIINKGDINNTAIIIIEGNIDNDNYIEVSNGATLYIKGDLDNANTINNNGNIYVDNTVTGNGDIDGVGTLCHSNGITDPTKGAKGNDISCEICGDDPSSLPVQLISFNAFQSNSNITINWTTASEENNDYFEVLRSIDGENFKVIAEIAGDGNSNLTLDYSIIDTEVDNNTYYYMLKQTDYDSKFTVSEMVVVNISSELNTKVYPNPISQGETLNIEFESINNNQIGIYDINGRNIKTINTNNINQTLDISELASGIYMLQIQSGTQVKVEKLIIK